jgi:acyl-coenzyme A thioesterase PaaI-like protein
MMAPMITADAINEMLEQLWPDCLFRCSEVSEDRALAVGEPGPDALRPGRYISGPTVFAAADAALWFLVAGAVGRLEPLALTSELSIRYLRPAQGRRLYARASLDKAARRSVVGTVRVWTDDNDDAPSAVAQGTYVLPAAPSDQQR